MNFPTPTELELLRLFELCFGALKGDRSCSFPGPDAGLCITNAQPGAIYVNPSRFSDDCVKTIIARLNQSSWSAQVESVNCRPAKPMDKGQSTFKLLVIKPAVKPNQSADALRQAIVDAVKPA